MTTFDYDLFVIGAGSGGVRAARLAAQAGLKVAVAEEYRPGGTCVVRGCVPKKFMVYASEVSHQLDYARGFGWDVEAKGFDWSAFKAANQAEVTRLSGIYATNLQKTGAELILERAEFTGPHSLVLKTSGREVTAKTILIAVGGGVWLPHNIPGVTEHALSSNEMFELETLPKSILIAGGGYIAVEFAGIMNGLGVETTLVYRGEKILRGFDEDVRDHLTDEIQKAGIRLITGIQHTKIEATSAGKISHMSDGSTIETEAVMFAVGRRPLTEKLGLEKAGVTVNEIGAVVVDAFSQTSQPHIYAVGDVTDRVNLTPVAIREAVAFIETVVKGKPTAYDHDLIPTAVFSQPPVGTAGLTEFEAKSKGYDFDVYVTRFRPMKTTFVKGESRTLMKLIVDKATDVVLGVHIVGPDSPEMIQLAGIAIKAKLTKAQWDATCAVHPTAAEELVTLKDPRA